MNEYSIPVENMQRLFKKERINKAIYYLLAIIIFSFRIFKEGWAGKYYVLILLAVIGIFTCAYFWAIKRAKTQLENAKLFVDNQRVIISMPPFNRKEIYYHNIKKIVISNNGLKLVDKDHSFRSAFVSRNFANFEEIEKIILANIEPEVSVINN